MGVASGLMLRSLANICFFFFKQKTAYEIDCDWSSDVCSSDLGGVGLRVVVVGAGALERTAGLGEEDVVERRRVQAQVGDRDALAVERADDLGDVAGALGEARDRKSVV